MTTGPPDDRGSQLDGINPWLVVLIAVAVAVLFVWAILSLLSAGASSDDRGPIPGASDPGTELAVGGDVPSTPPAPLTTRPADRATISPEEPGLVDRFPLGERQGHDTSNDDRRAAYGDIGAHCFVGEECDEIPAAVDEVNGTGGGIGLPGLGGSGTGGADLGDLFGGAGRGVSGVTPGSGGVSIAGGGGSADTAARRDANRVPQGERGAHCFVGEACPPIPAPSGAGDRGPAGTAAGEVVPCGSLGVHSRVGQTRPCVNGVISRVGTDAVPDGIGAVGDCYRVIARDALSATVIAIPCPDAPDQAATIRVETRPDGTLVGLLTGRCYLVLEHRTSFATVRPVSCPTTPAPATAQAVLP